MRRPNERILGGMLVPVLEDPTRVCAPAAKLIRGMLQDGRPGYAWASRVAVDAIERGMLVGIQSSWCRFLITLHEPRARPAPCRTGAIFQAMPARRGHDTIGWIVLANDYRGGALVLVHEIGHFIHRDEVRRQAEQDAPLRDEAWGDGLASDAIQGTRAQFLNELAARHLAWLSESGADPGRRPMPKPGALFACAVKIASYPEIYNDCGVVRRVVASGTDALRDQVGLWMQGFEAFRFFEEGSMRQAEHGRWLLHEVGLAAAGSRAPHVDAEGTL